LLAQLGLTCQKPLWRAYQQDGSRVEQWLKSEYPRIRALAKRKSGRFTSKMSPGCARTSTAKHLGGRGQTPVVRVTGQRFSLNMISAISPRGALRFMVVKAAWCAGVHSIPQATDARSAAIGVF